MKEDNELVEVNEFDETRPTDSSAFVTSFTVDKSFCSIKPSEPEFSFLKPPPPKFKEFSKDFKE